MQHCHLQFLEQIVWLGKIEAKLATQQVIETYFFVTIYF